MANAGKIVREYVFKRTMVDTSSPSIDFINFGKDRELNVLCGLTEDGHKFRLMFFKNLVGLLYNYTTNESMYFKFKNANVKLGDLLTNKKKKRLYKKNGIMFPSDESGYLLFETMNVIFRNDNLPVVSIKFSNNVGENYDFTFLVSGGRTLMCSYGRECQTCIEFEERVDNKLLSDVNRILVSALCTLMHEFAFSGGDFSASEC